MVYCKKTQKLIDMKVVELSENCLNKQFEKLSNKHVLIAEDNKINQMVLIEMLKKVGAIISIVENGQDAFNIYEQKFENIDIIMDYEMPIMDGAQASVLIRNFEKQNNQSNKLALNIPIITLTTHGTQAHYNLCLNSGINEFLTKPLNADKLYEVLLNYI